MWNGIRLRHSHARFMSCSTDVFSVMVPTTLPWLSMSTPLVLGRLSFACLPASAASGQRKGRWRTVRDFHPGLVAYSLAAQATKNMQRKPTIESTMTPPMICGHRWLETGGGRIA